MFFWLSLGAWWGGGDAGLWCVDGDNGAGGAGWGIGSRLSGQNKQSFQLHIYFRRDYPPPLVASWHLAWVN